MKHPDATIVAGATDVGLWITKKLTPLQKIIHVGRVAELGTVEESARGFEFGAIVSLTRAAPALGSIDPDVAEVLHPFSEVIRRDAVTLQCSLAEVVAHCVQCVGVAVLAELGTGELCSHLTSSMRRTIPT